MKVGRLFLLLVLLSPTGCSFVYYGAQSLFSEPYDALQECVFRNRIRQRAKEAWQQICAANGRSHSVAYAEGFEEGFVDFVDADGTGEPPAAAPPHLRRQLLRSEAGQSAIDDWFAGFRHGAATARASGLREKYVMPIALPVKPPQDPMPAQVVVPIPAGEPVKTSLRSVPAVAPPQAALPVLEPLLKTDLGSSVGYATWEQKLPELSGRP